MPSNLFEELKEALATFKGFLDENVPKIQEGINLLASLIPQINDLIAQLKNLLNSIKTEIQNLDVSSIPGLSEISGMTGQVTSLLNTAKDLLPDQASEIDSVLSVANVVTGLPSLDEVKTEIVTLIDGINGHLTSLQSTS